MYRNHHSSPYHDYAQVYQHPQEPQELPINSATPAPYLNNSSRNHKSVYGHTRGPSELPGVENMRSELETPETTPKNRQSGFKQPSPMSPQGEFLAMSPGQPSPMSAASQFGSRNSVAQEMNQGWVAPSNWQYPPPPEVDDGPRGLGVSDDGMDRMERVDEQRAYQRQTRSHGSAYHGV